MSYINNLIYTTSKIYKALGVKSAFVYECGTCTLNNVEEMINFITTMYNYSSNKTKYEDIEQKYKDKYNKDTYGKFEILRLPKDLSCNHTPDNEQQFLVNYGFQINGFNVTKNYPLKLHKCKRNEMESIYRQIQSGISYDQKIMKEFIKFSHKIIDKLIDDYYAEHFDDGIISLDDYYSKIGCRRKEYEQGYEKYCNGGKLEMVFRMHNKDDEKQYVDFNTFKSKARNICAQLPMGKILLGIPCELGMEVLHSYDWCGPGSNYGVRCKKFKNWISNIANCGVICCDGSSFDSTQHQILIKEIDAYFLRRILQYNTYLDEYFNLQDVLDYIEQDQFTIFSKYGFWYRIMGTQLSGRMNTCLSNTLRSGLYIMFILNKMNILNKDNLVKFEVNGDDQIIFINNNLMNKYEEYAYKYVYDDKESNKYHGLGQICKIFDKYPKITGAEYLSTYFIYDDVTNDIWMIRKPERFLQMIPFTFRIGTRNKKKLDYQRTILGLEIIQGQLHELGGAEFYEVLLNKYFKLLKKKLKYFEHIGYKLVDRNLIRKIGEIHRLLKMKNKGGQEFNGRFNELFYQFLLEKFKINNDDIKEYFELIEKCDDLDGSINVGLVDKFYPEIKSHEDFNIKCKNLFHNKSYIYVDNPSSNKIKNSDFFVNN